MRRATLYTLNSTEILAGGFHEMLRMNAIPVAIGNSEAIAPIETERFTIPIHVVTRCTRPTTRPVNGSFDYDRQDTFFAVEPALAEILNAPFKAELDAAKADLEKRIASFNDLPWYRRIWAALRRDV